MKAMILESEEGSLKQANLPIPIPNENEVLLKVMVCGICRTDLHVLEGDLPNPKYPIILGHEIVGKVIAKGSSVKKFSVGQRLGVPWLGRSCGRCHYCMNKRENLCNHALFTGYTIDGGYAEYIVAHQNYCLTLPDVYSDSEVAPLLCAGLIGYRALCATGDAERLGVYGFGAAGHIITQIAQYQGREVFAFTKQGDVKGQEFAIELGAAWAGDSKMSPPKKMDAAIIFAPIGALIPEALCHTVKGGIVVCAGIHMSDIPQFPYSLLWGERSIRSIANLTRQDGVDFLALASKVKIKVEIQSFPLSAANEGLKQLKLGNIRGAAVLVLD